MANQKVNYKKTKKTYYKKKTPKRCKNCGKFMK